MNSVSNMINNQYIWQKHISRSVSLCVVCDCVEAITINKHFHQIDVSVIQTREPLNLTSSLQFQSPYVFDVSVTVVFI